MLRSTFTAAALAAVFAVGACAPDDTADSAIALSVPGVTRQGLTTTTTLTSVADTHVRRNSPYSAYGSEGLLRVGTADRRKSFVRFDAAAIATALAGQQVVSAHLELFLGNAVASFPVGQAVVAQPLSQAFVEARATYSCADDTAPTNWANNCTTANLWNLETSPFPWRSTGIPRPLTNGTTGVVRFDVTADLVDVANGTYPHHGWIVLRTMDTVGGEANFRSREDVSGPRLVLVTEPAPPSAVCGDGVVNGTDECDDGNDVDGDGCTDCVIDECGDGVVNNGDECDDGNDVDGDGCTACVIDVCGDGIVNNDDECDDGNDVDGDGCTVCVIDVCGDGVANNGDECDDGNDVDGDGCTACVIDPVCGDGVVNGSDECDDGNDVETDGCRSDCTLVPTFSITTTSAAVHVAKSAVQVPDGRIAVNSSTGSSTFNPATGLWSATVTTTNLLLDCQTVLNDGTLFAASYNQALTYTAGGPRTSRASPSGGQLTTCTTLPDGRVLRFSGGVVNSNWATAPADVYDPATNTWQATTSYQRDGGPSIRLDVSRTLLPTRSMIVETPSLNFRATAQPGPAHMQGRHAVMLANGLVLLGGGGGTPSGVPTAATTLFDPQTETWSPAANMLTARTRASALLLPSGDVLVSGGDADGSSMATTEVYHPSLDLWTPSVTLPSPRSEHVMLLLQDERVFIVGGIVYTPNSTGGTSGSLVRSADMLTPL
ncbi:MAG TPA: DUF4215 domain-containing protein [Myxococcota bacterium]